ncbi:MAG: hypothetical protein ACI85O_001374 [Saprospiraceae bacterium]|jgi:hypothetical protein
MKNTQYDFVISSDFKIGHLNQKSKDYAFYFIGEDLSSDKFKSDLKAVDFQGNQEDLRDFLKNNKVVSIGLIKKGKHLSLSKELDIIQQKINLEQSHFAVLVPYKDPDIHIEQGLLPSEECFMISTDSFFRFYKKGISIGLCYHFMLCALEQKGSFEQIIAHQTGHPNAQIYKDFGGAQSTEIIMPHRGNTDDLETALWYLEKQKIKPKKVSVCFDENVTERHFEIADENQNVRFFVNYPAGVGPYPSRDVLARTTAEEVILFHDSDDVSTSDRTSTLMQFLNDENLDAAGSHELRIDKIEKKITAVRYPLKVIDAIGKEGKFSIFFPTTAIKTTAYLKTGGLSTVRKHSSDSQFYKRAYFFLNMENVDEFLYIRVKRENSLTTEKATALGSPIRERLREQWENDFIRVQNQNINLLDSTLIDEYNNVHVDVIPLSEKYRKTILDRQVLDSILQEQSLSNQIKKKSFPEEENVLKERILDYRLVKDPGVHVLKKSFSWRIGWEITRVIMLLFGWIPFIKKRL